MASSNKQKIRVSIIIVLILLVLGIIFYPKIKERFKTKTAKAPSGAPAAVRQQALFASGYILVPTQMEELRKLTGTLIPDEEVDLSFETSGKVVAIYFSEGTKVTKGDLLAKMNDKPLQAQLLKLQAQLKLSQEKEFRQRQLLDRDAISRESYDQIATELQTLDADIKLIEARIAETELRAPFDGIVGLRMISEGAYATPTTKIANMVKLKPLKIEFSVPEIYAGEIKPGYQISFRFDRTEKSYPAQVYAVEPKVDVDSRVIVIRAKYPNANEELMPGRYVNVFLLLSQIDNAISIPTEAIIPEMDGDKVFLLKNGRAEKVKVVIGLRTESKAQIKEGLNFGDTLLTTATLQLRQSTPVQLDTLITNR
ncbi:MAG: efflux RND transporter periplasmic adaptor subunit [Prolixibacteraceae bacterium]|nr:efflux RND transporter periplasmic adaptor subunit [Prolixibacteraceae bacterium]